ncbi:MAG: amino acid-binding protein [Spirochaetaceae bacterium]|jgi:hypothetical protein|nr:amino acid-binding protein [Spirochaetaceae bacterium]
MRAKQISVFLENSAGRLAEVTGCLADANINLQALSIADTADFGILRIIVDKPAKAKETLISRGFTARETDVLVTKTDGTSDIARLMELFSAANINIEYLYSALNGMRGGGALVIFKLDDIEAGQKIVEENGIIILEQL